MPIASTPAVFTFAAPTAPHPQLNSNSDSSKASRNISGSHSCCSTSSSSSSSSVVTHTTSTEQLHETSKKFSYSRASPSVRWPNRKYVIDNHRSKQTQLPISFTKPKVDGISKNKPEDKEIGRKEESLGMNDDTLEALGKLSYRLKQTQLPITFTTPKVDVLGDGFSTNKPEDKEIGKEGESLGMNDETLEAFGKPSRRVAKKMNKLALKRAQDWRNRVQFLTDSILGLKSDEFVADVLGDRQIQMTPTDFCFLVKCVGKTSWQRSLEVYEWLNLRHWYSPNAPMVATILAVLGKANQEALAVEIFEQAIEVVKSAVQMYNSMMGVYARNGRFHKVQELLDLMRERGCEPDLVSFNTLINARLRSGPMEPNMALDLLHQVRRSGLQPDIITYNTLLSACSRDPNLEAAIKVYDDMEANRCQPDLWTYNTMLSIYGRCGMSNEAELMFEDLGSKGFLPDAVTYNSLLYVFAREGRVDKAEKLREEMVKMGFVQDEMTYNTIIHMYGKQGRCDLALQLYREMKSRGRVPDVVTYTVLIDSLGKADNISEAVNVMSEMVKAGIKPTLRTCSALICGYSKAGKRLEAEETFDCMLRSGIKPDLLAYSVMLDIYLRFDEIKKAMKLYDNMVRDGFTPELALYEFLVRALGRQNKEDQIQRVIDDMEKVCYLSAQVILSILVKSECYNYVAKTLKLAVLEGYCLDRENLLSILGSYSSSGRQSEALDLLDFVKEHMPGSHDLVTEARILILCKANQLDAALDEYRKSRSYSLSNRSFSTYESLIKGCDETGLLSEASQVLSDMLFVGVQPSKSIYTSVALMYCKMGIPETAHNLLERAEADGISIEDISVYVGLIEAYGNSNLLEKVEIVVAGLRQIYPVLDRKAWNALIQVYASKGQYEKARAAFNTMMRDGPSPTVDSVNGLMQALVVDGRLDELYVVVEELQDMGFKISKNSIILMLDAFAQAGNVFEAKKIYHGMKAAGYFPTMHLYRVMIGLLCRVKHVRDVEAMIAEMEEVGFKPDLSIWNSLLKLYTNIEDYRKTAQVYQRIKDDGLKPDEETYNTLIVMYCRDRRPEEGLSLMDEMVKEGLDAKLTTYKSLIAAFGKLQMVEQAEDLFGKMKREGYKLDLSFYHLMMKMYRSIGHHSKSEELLVSMKEAGIEPTTATMHLLMISYGSSGNPVEAEKVLENLKSSGEGISTLTYSSVIDAYLKNGDYDIGIQKLSAMKGEGIEPDHRIWTCFIRAASFCKSTSEAMMLLNAVGDAGFDLPVRLLKNSETMVMEIDQLFEKLAPMGDNAALNFANAVEDLLWAFELRATASWVFQLAIKKEIYRRDIFRVADNDWGADFRKLSAGAALVGLTLWLDHMQDAALEGFPLSPKSVVLVTGTAEYNAVSLNGTLKAYLWEMGSPFRPCKTRSGLFMAKAHSLKMWLKDSPFCFDLELKNSNVLPEINSMQLIDGCYIRRGLVPAFKDITERLGRVGPKKFSRLALLSDEKRVEAIQADIDGRKEKLEKLKRRGVMQKKKSSRKRKFVRKEAVNR